MIATMALASCANDDAANGGNNNGEGTDTFAGITVILPDTATRAEDANAGINAEKDLKTIGIYIVDVNTGRFDYQILDVNATNFTSSNEAVTNRPIRTANVAIKTVTGDKKVFVVANAVAAATGTSALQSAIDSKRGAMVNPIGIGLAATDFYFLTAGVLDRMVISGVSAQIALGVQTNNSTDTNGALNAANLVSVSIERNLAKVVMQKGPDYAVVGGTTTLTWALGGMAKDSFFVPQTSATSLYAAVPAAAEGDKTDAYWDNFSAVSAATIPAADYISVLAAGTDANTATAAEGKYCFENFRTTKLFEGNTTTAVIKGQFVPAEVYYMDGTTLKKGTSANLDASKDFYWSKVDGNYYTNDARAEVVNNGINGHTNSVTDFKYYAAGVGYYHVYVQDAAGVRGVKRNSYYLLQINKVTGPGTPLLDPEETDPLDEDSFIAVSVTVKYWDFQKSGHNIQ